jgi:hypothetical protein
MVPCDVVLEAWPWLGGQINETWALDASRFIKCDKHSELRENTNYASQSKIFNEWLPFQSLKKIISLALNASA